MLQKGTEQYKEASKLANELKKIASTQRWNSNTLYNLYFDPFYRFLEKIKELNVFASKIAETIDNKARVNMPIVAFMSDKQAWILACAAIENNIEEQYITD